MTRYASDRGLDAVPATATPHDGAGALAALPRASREPASPRLGKDAAPPLGREARRRIGRDLRLLYADVLNQPLPDRFTALLDGLSSQSDSRGSQ
ncbi:NepR family anti-sigma factor [Methylobacterium sp. J-090]|uniref:NepR family anti-sigma factor n=1 Tax=Methylobacterium sp. J-090 TaxID=2836666 RepID=UPI001FBA7AD6|nr:NepR family anti-sigma factor [Methylobacterium sp. J-090]MCJ2081009.1 hypothetical protein [Methylobacterium sp. J-090]